MSLQTLKAPFYFPKPIGNFTGGPTYTAPVIDAADESETFIVRAPKTGNIAKVFWATRNVSTGATLDVRLESVSLADGLPTGTLLGANTNGPQVVVNTDDNKGFLTPLTANLPVTKGDLVAVVIKNPNTSFGTIQIAALNDDYNEFPYSAINTGVSPAVSYTRQSTTVPILAFEYDDGSYEHIPGVYPLTAINIANPTTATTPDVWGARFKFPFPCRVRGAWAWFSGSGDINVKLVNTAYHQANNTGVLASIAADKDTYSGAVGLHLWEFNDAVALAANTYYRLLIEPSSASAIAFYDGSVLSLALLDAWAGQDFHLTSAKDPTQNSDWTNYNSGTFRVPFIGLIIDQLDDGINPAGHTGSKFNFGLN